MRPKNSREYINEILLAVRRLRNGAKADSIVDYIRRQFLKNKSYPTGSVASKIKRDLQSAVETGLLRHSNGKYHLIKSMEVKRSAGRVRRGSSRRGSSRRRRRRRVSRSRSRSRSRHARRSGSRRRSRSGSRINNEMPDRSNDEQNQSNNGNEGGEQCDCDPECICDLHNHSNEQIG